MESLREQLERLYPVLRNDLKNATPPVAKAAVIPVKTAAPKSHLDDDWKLGVTPLSPSGRRDLSRSAGTEPVAAQKPTRNPDAGRNSGTGQPAARSAASRATTAPPAVSKLEVPKQQPVVESRLGGVRQPALARAAEFKEPESWVAAGAMLQPPTGGHGRVMQVRLGIDFGTAYTKVAIRAGDQVFFVPWSGLRNHEAPYFLPGEISLTSDGEVRLGRVADPLEVMNDLKLPFIEKSIGSREKFCAAIVFLAWVMRYARAWLYEHQPPLVNGKKIAWTVNLGCPASSWADKDMRFAYDTLGYFAWQVSQSPRDITWDAALSIAGLARPSAESIGLDALYSMPEFVAQLAGYVHSPQRQNGLHLLLDVGAGTVDFAAFNIGPDQMHENDRYDIFVSEVLPLGTHYLTAERKSRLGSKAGWDDFDLVPDSEQIVRDLGFSPALVKAADEEFQRRITTELERLLRYTRNRRYGQAPEWREGLPSFLSGGGSGCSVYGGSLDKAFGNLNFPMKPTRFPLLEEVAKIDGVGLPNFHRLSVAYGLTHDAESVGRIFTPREIADAPRYDPAVHRTRERPDRDDLYY